MPGAQEFEAVSTSLHKVASSIARLWSPKSGADLKEEGFTHSQIDLQSHERQHRADLDLLFSHAAYHKFLCDMTSQLVSPALKAIALGHLALYQAQSNHRDACDEIAEQIRALFEQRISVVAKGQVLAHLFRSYVILGDGNLAAEYLKSARTLIMMPWSKPEGWKHALTAIYCADACASLGEDDGAERLYHEALSILELNSKSSCGSDQERTVGRLFDSALQHEFYEIAYIVLSRSLLTENEKVDRWVALALAQAEAGHSNQSKQTINRALLTAGRLPKDDKDRLLCGAVALQAHLEEFSEVEGTLHCIENPIIQAQASLHVAKALSTLGFREEASFIIEQATGLLVQANGTQDGTQSNAFGRAVFELVRTYLFTGDPYRALQSCALLSGAALQAAAYIEVGKDFFARENRNDAYLALSNAYTLTEKLPETSLERTELLTQIAELYELHGKAITAAAMREELATAAANDNFHAQAFARRLLDDDDERIVRMIRMDQGETLQTAAMATRDWPALVISGDGGSIIERLNNNEQFADGNALEELIRTLSALGITRPPAEKGFDPALLAYVNAHVCGAEKRQLLHALSVFGGKKEIEQYLEMLPYAAAEPTRLHINAATSRFRGHYFYEGRSDIIASAQSYLDRVMSGIEHSGSMISAAISTLAKIDSAELREYILTLSKGIAQAKDDPRLPWLLDGLAEINTHRSNDLLLSIIKDPALHPAVTRCFIDRLVVNDYLDCSLSEWLTAHEAEGNSERARAEERFSVQVVQGLLSRGIIPSPDILDFIVMEGSATKFTPQYLDHRLAELRANEMEVRACQSATEALHIVANDERKALSFYMLNNGKTHFHLINNYSFGKFREIVTLADQYEIHQRPLQQFCIALRKRGMEESAVEAVRQNLIAGRYPFSSLSRERTIRLSVSNASLLDAANDEIAAVFGSTQLGVCLKAPLYRAYLKAQGGLAADNHRQALDRATTLGEREAALAQIERDNLGYFGRAIEELGKGWGRVNEKLMFNLGVGHVLRNPSNRVDGEILRRQIEERRQQLTHAKRHLIHALQSENGALKKIDAEIRSKERALERLHTAREFNPEVTKDISALTDKITLLHARKQELLNQPLHDRFAGLSGGQREVFLALETKKLAALAEKSSAKVCMIIISEIIGDDLLTESDVTLLREVTSHLEHPFQIIAQVGAGATRTATTERTLTMRYLDKKEDLMIATRFADSKICCFSSSNYTMAPGHGIANKHWVASIVKDPLSFIVAFIDPRERKSVHNSNVDCVENNVGFVFGMYGITKDGKPAIFYNGLYLAEGTNAVGTSNIMHTLEQMIGRPMRATAEAIGGHGLVEFSNLYSKGGLTGTRLRALKGSDGTPVTKIYDDIGTSINVFGSIGTFHRELE